MRIYGGFAPYRRDLEIVLPDMNRAVLSHFSSFAAAAAVFFRLACFGRLLHLLTSVTAVTSSCSD